MKQKTSCLTKIVISLILLLILVGVASYLIFSKYTDPSLYVAKLEYQFNCRASIDKIKVGAKHITIKDIALGYRDEEAEKEVPFKNRKPMQDPQISCANVYIKYDYSGLLNKELKIDEVAFDKLKIKAQIDDNGKVSLRNMFKKSKKRIADESKNKSKDSSQETNVAKVDSEIRAEDIPLNNLLISNLNVNDANFDIKVSKAKQRFNINNAQIDLEDINISPKDLSKNNNADLSFSANINIHDFESDEKFALIPIKALAKIIPFNIDSRTLKPEVNGKFTVEKGANFGNFPLLKKINANINKLSQVAFINFEKPIEIKSVTEDADFEVNFYNGKATLKNLSSFNTEEFTLKINENSWLNFTNNIHEISGNLEVSEILSKPAIQQAKDKLLSSINELEQSDVDNLFTGITNDEGSRIDIKFQSSGSFDDPKLIENTTSSFLKEFKNNALKTTVDKLGEKLGEKIKEEAGKKIGREINKFLEGL